MPSEIREKLLDKLATHRLEDYGSPDPVETCYWLDTFCLMNLKPDKNLIDHSLQAYQNKGGFVPLGHRNYSLHKKREDLNGWWTETVSIFIIGAAHLFQRFPDTFKNEHRTLVDKGVDWLLDNQYPSSLGKSAIAAGGWALGDRTEGVLPYLFSTYMAFYALKYYSQFDPNNKRLEKIEKAKRDAIAWFVQNVKEESNGDISWPIFTNAKEEEQKDPLSTLYALELLGEENEQTHDLERFNEWLPGAMNWLLNETDRGLEAISVYYPYSPYYEPHGISKPDRIEDRSHPVLLLGACLSTEHYQAMPKDNRVTYVMHRAESRVMGLLDRGDASIYQGLAELVNDYPKHFGSEAPRGGDDSKNLAAKLDRNYRLLLQLKDGLDRLEQKLEKS